MASLRSVINYTRRVARPSDVSDQPVDPESVVAAHHALDLRIDKLELGNSEAFHKNGNGNGRVRVPWAASAIFLAAVAYTVTVVIWGARLQSEVEELERLFKLHDTLESARMKEINGRVDSMDVAGTRALAPVALRSTQIEGTLTAHGRQIDGVEQAYNALAREMAVIKDRQDRGIADMQRLENQLRELRQKTQ